MDYFRITVYSPERNVSAILDCNGHHDKLWKFTSYFVKNNWQLIAVGKDGEFEDGNIPRVEEDTEHILLRACMTGCVKSNNGQINISGRYYKNNR